LKSYLIKPSSSLIVEEMYSAGLENFLDKGKMYFTSELVYSGAFSIIMSISSSFFDSSGFYIPFLLFPLAGFLGAFYCRANNSYSQSC
jgi:hypothetical protein